MNKLKLYVDRKSQPARALIIFCRLNGIDFEEITVDFIKRQTHSPDFIEINPMKQVPAIVHGGLKLFESNAILRYLACAFPGVPDHWYPADLSRRAKIDSVLDWHHLNLRRGATTYVQSTVLGPVLGRTNPQKASESEKIVAESLSSIETFWLKGNEKFLLGNSQPSIADLNLVSEIMQLEVLTEKDINKFLGPYRKVLQWVEDLRNATNPHFDEAHKDILGVKEKYHGLAESTIRGMLPSQM
ncbi:glutathione S-transferase T1-like [Macadamia integrifolia]|uniref:glutathione S-transferase T1-like n=1 Tax=Macadamia integrifolia TaxID=60698 RepID=UPI001C52FE90|nr:glutathione S-transferase T1-like [Macadamia integrifolia]